MVLGTVEVAEDAADVFTGSLAVLLSAAEGREAKLIHRQYLCVGFAGFHPVKSGKQLLSFNPLKPLVSHQYMSLLKCNPLTSVPLLCSSHAQAGNTTAGFLHTPKAGNS